VRWMDAIIVPAVPILGIYCFVVIARFDEQKPTRKTSRAAESMSGNHADPFHKQRRRTG